MTRIRLSWFRILAITAVAGSLAMIAIQLMNRSGITPKEKDFQRSRRELTPKEGVDERAEIRGIEVVSGTGVIEPRSRETKVAAAGAGLISRIAVKEGQVVTAGQVLLELEGSAERAAAESARQEIESARRELDRVRAGERSETIAAAKQDLQAAEAKAVQSAEVFERLKELAPKDLVTRDEYDRARRQADQDAALAAASKARYEALANGPRQEDIAVQEAQLAHAQRRLSERDAALRLRQVRAPSGGLILQIKYRAGEYYVPGGEPILLLGDLSQRRARIDIDERDISRVRVGDPAVVTAPAFAGRRFPARVAEIGQRIGRKNIRTDDPKERIDTKILEVVLDLDADAPELLPGLRVEAMVGEGKSE